MTTPHCKQAGNSAVDKNEKIERNYSWHKDISVSLWRKIFKRESLWKQV